MAHSGSSWLVAGLPGGERGGVDGEAAAEGEVVEEVAGRCCCCCFSSSACVAAAAASLSRVCCCCCCCCCCGCCAATLTLCSANMPLLNLNGGGSCAMSEGVAPWAAMTRNPTPSGKYRDMRMT